MVLHLQIGQLVSNDPEEEKKQRAVKGLLNKLTPEKFDKIIQDIVNVGYQDEKTESGLIDQVKPCTLAFGVILLTAQ